MAANLPAIARLLLRGDSPADDRASGQGASREPPAIILAIAGAVVIIAAIAVVIAIATVAVEALTRALAVSLMVSPRVV